MEMDKEVWDRGLGGLFGYMQKVLSLPVSSYIPFLLKTVTIDQSIVTVLDVGAFCNNKALKFQRGRGSEEGPMAIERRELERGA